MKLNAEDWIGLFLVAGAMAAGFVLAGRTSGSLEIAMATMIVIALTFGGAYFAVIGYVERVVVPRINKEG